MHWLSFPLCAVPVVGVLVTFILVSLTIHLIGVARLRRRWRLLSERFDVEELASRLGVSADDLRALQPTYTERTIPKKSGGTRRLLIPNPDLKRVQRLINRRVLARLRAHPAATGFERGKSVVHNALPHVGQRVALRMDLLDFFTSTRADRVHRYFRRIGWKEEAADLLVRLTTHGGGLP